MTTTQASAALPQLAGRPVVTDGGLETDLIYHHDVDLPHFAAFPLVDDAAGPGAAAGLLRRLRLDRQASRRRAAVGDADMAGEQRLGRPPRVLGGGALPSQPRRRAAARRAA